MAAGAAASDASLKVDPRVIMQEAMTRHCVQRDPTDYIARYNLGSALQILGRLDESAEEYRRVLRFVPRDPVARNSRKTWLGFPHSFSSTSIYPYRDAVSGLGFFKNIFNREYAKKQELYLPQEVLRLPFFLSIALARISSPRELLPVVAELRQKAATFRAHRRKLDAALREGKGGKVLQNLQQAIRGDADKIRAISPIKSAASFMFSVLPLFFSPISSVLMAALVALKAAAEYRPEDIEKLRDRALERQLWFLTDLRGGCGGTD
jgi:tetratricopeptide (TPR) repeat protein